MFDFADRDRDKRIADHRQQAAWRRTIADRVEAIAARCDLEGSGEGPALRRNVAALRQAAAEHEAIAAAIEAGGNLLPDLARYQAPGPRMVQ